MTGRLSVNIIYLIAGLLFFTLTGNYLQGQSKSISGIINSYGRVTSFGTDYVIIKDDGANAGQFSAFHKDDTVLLIQMKGVRTYVTETSSYGTLEGNYGLPGQHEFLIVESVEPGTKRITFRNNISHTAFSTVGDLQLVRVPSFNAATVVSKLTCEPWDSVKKTGGVLALITGRTLTLNDSISVIGKGFKGGTISTGLGVCTSEDVTKMYRYAYAAATDSAGFKGEGPVSRGYLSSSNFPPIYPVYAKGKGANLSAGGGGNGRYSGGGGGGNYGGGGIGGVETGCAVNRPGGIGGIQVKGTYLANTLKSLLLGGGGGTGTYITGGTSSQGGNGGGIVIIVSDTIKAATSKPVIANGADAKAASGNAGAGGGGGGGTVALYAQSFSNLNISASGGKGGAAGGTYGGGGGGGGGLITTNNPSSVTGVVRTYNGGTASSTGSAGAAGENLTTWVPILNGFLFNSIRSSITNTQVDSICSNQVPYPLTGTLPIGGSGNYTYTWQISRNAGSTWSELTSGAGSGYKDYTFTGVEADTFLVRRIVLDNVTSLTDTSKWIQINVTPAITGNLVGKDTTICNGQNPLNLIPLNAGPSNGNGHYQYQWLQNTNDLNWESSPDASGTSNGAQYDPPVLNITTYYQRRIISGRCISFSPTVTITVLPSITGNITDRPDSVICEGSTFNILTASAPAGGTGAFTYLWQDSTATGTWQPAFGANTATTHSPSVIPFATVEHRYFRRVVISGPDDVCKNYSSPIRLTMWQAIETNNISADQTICSGDTPAGLTGLQPTRGDNVNYLYQWQDSSKLATWTTRATGSLNTSFNPPALTDTTWYRRVVTSSKCTSTSNKIVVNVHDPITNNLIEADTTICNGGNPKLIRGKVPAGGNHTFTYQWYTSSDNFVSNNDPVTVSGTFIGYDPAVLSADRYYRREVSSGMCKTLSNIVKVTVLPSITANTISPDRTEVCFNTVPGTITGTPLTGGAGGTPTWVWQDSTSGTSWTNIGSSTQNFIPSSPISERMWFRRIIRSGPADCCIDTSSVVSIDTLTLPTASIISTTDTTICSGQEVRLRLNLTGARNWKTLVYNENATQVTVSNISSSNYTISRIPSVGNSMTTFNYTISSLVDNNDCVAAPAGLSGSRRADVYRVPVANAGPDDAVCGPVYTLAAVPSDGTGTWIFPPAVLSGNSNLFNALIKIDSSFTSASVTHKLYWQEVNWNCSSKDSVTITFYNRIDGIDAGNDTSMMSFDNAFQLKADPIKPFETGKWSVIEGTGVFDNDVSLNPWITGASIGSNTYRWTVENGECKLEDEIEVIISNPVVPELVSPNGDGFNDELNVGGINIETQKVELSILNGAGTLVFSTSNVGGNEEWTNWKGKDSSGKELPEGTYYYLLKVSSGKVTGHVSKKSGFIILKRK